jgi:acylphosphatase
MSGSLWSFWKGDSPMERELARLRLIVTGRVQGVFFRRAAVNEARALGLKGFARNRPEGSVEILAEGERSNLEVLLAWSRQGPPHAHVEDVKPIWGKFAGEFGHFKVR